MLFYIPTTMIEKNDIELLKELNCSNKDIYISCNSVIKNKNIVLGDHIAIGPFFYSTVNLILKDYIHLGSDVSIIGGNLSTITIGSFVGISIGTKILAGTSDYFNEGLISLPVLPKHLQKNIHNPIIINDFVMIGANCTILNGIELGQGSVIAAGSVVTKNTEPWTMYKGVPARPYKKVSKKKKIEEAISLGYKPTN